MIHYDFGSIEAPKAPEHFVLRNFRQGDEQVWADIVNVSDMGAFDAAGVKDYLTGRDEFDPNGHFFACDATTGEAVGTASAWRTLAFGVKRPRLHMVAVKPQARRKGLARTLCLAVLHHFADLGESEVLVATRDYRRQAMAMYLSLGFLPLRYIEGEDHIKRWRAALSEISAPAELKFAKPPA